MVKHVEGSLEEFIYSMRKEIINFRQAYEIKNAENPEQYPLMLSEDNDGLWLEFFLTYLTHGGV